MPAPKVEKSHFISRCLIRKWQRSDNHVRVFDFDTNAVERRGPREMVFVSETPFPPLVEALLGEEIERKLGIYLTDWERKNDGKLLPMTREVRRLLAVAIFTQVARTQHAQGSPDWGPLQSVGAASLDWYEAFLLERGEVIGCTLERERLYFPLTGLVALPLERFNGFFLPLLPQAFAAFVPYGASVPPWMRDERNVKALSVGLQGSKVIVPPNEDVDPTTLHAHRATARRLASGV